MKNTSHLRAALAAVLLGTIMAACGGGGGSAAAPQETVAATPSGKVLFVGGSVTQGAWANAGNSYAELTAAWLKTKLGAVEVRNIAIGSTDSRFAVYRLEQDLGTFRPDIAFIEFGINDEPDRAFVTANVDGLIYKLRRVNPGVVVVFIQATYPDEAALRRAGARDSRSGYAKDVVERNGGIFVDAGELLWHYLLLTGRDPREFYTDALHPNDLGHASYFDSIAQALGERIATAKGIGSVTSTYIAQSKLDAARLVDPSSAITSSTCPVGSSDRLEFAGQAPSYFDVQYQCRAGDRFTARFTGTSFGLTTLAANGAGRLICTLDGSATSTVDLADTTTRLKVSMLFEYRASGAHEVVCTAVGGLVVFGDALVSGAAPVSP